MNELTRSQVNAYMEEVLEIRYEDIELEKVRCDMLLAWGEAHGDNYVVAFSYTYLGDHYFTKEDYDHCVSCLMKARDIALTFGYHDLLVRIYSLLGLHYDAIADEQSSLHYYMEGITMCRVSGNVHDEVVILNNIAYYLQRHEDLNQALKLYQQALRMVDKNAPTSLSIYSILLNNAATTAVLLEQLPLAKSYILTLENDCKKFPEYDLLLSQVWCQYFVAINDEQQALYWADHLLDNREEMMLNKQYSFDVFVILFDSMMKLGNQQYAVYFKGLLYECCSSGSTDRRKRLEVSQMAYSITYEKDEARLNEAFKQYAIAMRELEEMSNGIITSGLKDAVSFYYVSRQKEALEDEQGTLDNQVNVDELTRVYTRRFLDNLIKDIPGRNITTIGFIMLDMDCLKEFNDTYGHLVGDQALQYVGEIMNKYAVDGIYPCRFGGDEFVCVCLDVDDEAIETYIQAMRYDLANKHILHETSRCANEVTLSIGYANEQYSVQTDVDMILKQADEALYRAKLLGRNRYCKYNGEEK